MNTFLVSLLLHRQSDESADHVGLERLLQDLRAVALEHGYSFGEYEALGLPGEHFPISPCSDCKHLTLGWSPTPEELDDHELLTRFLPRAIHPGEATIDGLLCSTCRGKQGDRA